MCGQWAQAAKPDKKVNEYLRTLHQTPCHCKDVTYLKPSESSSHLENPTQFKLSSITTLAMYWRAQACSINYKPYTNKSLKGMKRKWGPGHLSSRSCSYVGWTAACSWMLMWFPSPQISLTEHLPVSAKINHLNKGQFFSLLMLSWLIVTAKGWEGAHRAVLTPRTWGGSGSLFRQTFFSVIVMLLHWIITRLSKGKNKHNVFLPRRTEKIAYIHIYNVQHKYLKFFNI